tara:strand:+ start:142 stop:1113 length:972 start_codon:yes stop_codon:yes gene_type:complete
MRAETYRELQQQFPNFVDEYTRVIPLSKITYSNTQSQFRSKGHQIGMVPAFAATMRADGPRAFPPATVKELPNGTFELVDGNTRALAAEDAKTDLFVSLYHDTLNLTTSEWEDLQAEFNDHPKSSPNSEQDIKDYISRQQKSGQMDRKVGFSYTTKEAEYITAAVAHYRKMLSNTGKSKAWWKTVINKSLAGNIGIRYETYTKGQLFEMYKTWEGFSGTKVSDISGGESVFTFSNVSDLSPQVMGSVATKEQHNEGIRHTLVFAVGDMAGRDDESIKAQRERVSDWAEGVRARFGWNVNVFFAPQIKSGDGRENLRKFVDTNK